MTQNFKGDAVELKMQDVVNPIFDLTDIALDEFYADGFDCSQFLLMLYDEKRMTFSDRVPRAAFVDFVKEALKNFPFTGSFESYIFVLRSIFGALSDINFDIPSPGKLFIDIGAISSSEFDFIGREFVGGSYSFFNIVDDDLNQLIFSGVPGIDNAYDLGLLFSEIMPVGIDPSITLEFVTRSDWIGEDPGPTFFDMVDDSFNQFIFHEVRG